MNKQLKDRIIEHFDSLVDGYRFTWSDGKSYIMKWETINSLSKKLDCPYTSLYIPIHQLKDEGFLTFHKGFGLVIKEHDLLNSDKNDERSVATEDQSRRRSWYHNTHRTKTI